MFADSEIGLVQAEDQLQRSLSLSSSDPTDTTAMDARKAKQTLRGCFSADSYPSEGPSPDRLLDELLGDIRTLRSRTTSQASTPTALSSDCDESPGLRDRSETELRGLGEQIHSFRVYISVRRTVSFPARQSRL